MNACKRKFLTFFLGALLILGAICLLLPYWLPFAAKPVAAKFNLSWTGLTASGWSSYKIEGISYETNGVRISAEAVTIPQAYPLLWQFMKWSEKKEASADRLDIEILEKSARAETSKERKGLASLDEIKDSILGSADWIPNTRIGELAINGKDGETILLLEDLSMTGNRFEGKLSGISPLPPLALELLLEEDRYRLNGRPAERNDGLHLELIIHPSGTDNQATGKLYSNGVPLHLASDFEQGKWGPGSVRVKGDDWPVPGVFTDWTPWEEKSLLADIDFELVGRSYSAALRFSGEAGWTGYPAESIKADIAFTGNRLLLNVTECDIETDWLQANLSEPITFSLTTLHFLKDGQFNLKADLSKQDLFTASGQIRANALVDTRSWKEPELRIHVEAEQLDILGFPIPSLVMEGSYDYPDVNFESIRAILDEESSVTASGSYLLGKNLLEASGHWVLGPSWLQPYTGDADIITPVAGSISVRGPLSMLEHAGKLDKAVVHIEGLHPFSVSGSWSGTRGMPTDITARAETTGGGLATVGLVLETGPNWALRVNEGCLEDEHHSLTLVEAFDVNLSAEDKVVDRVSPFRLAGGASYLGGSYDRSQGIVLLEAGMLDLRFLEGWQTGPPIPVSIDHAQLNIKQAEPFLVADFSLKAHATKEQFEDLTLVITGKTGKEGIRLDPARGSMDGQTFMDGSFSLPLLLHPFGENSLLSPIPGQPIEGSLKAEISAELADKLPVLPRLGRLPGLKAHLTAEGTPEAPVAGMEISLQELNPFKEFDPRLEPYPLENLFCKARVTATEVQIEALEAGMAGGKLAASGSLSMETIGSLAREEGFTWNGILTGNAFELSLTQFKASSFPSILPSYLRPNGTLDGSLRSSPGKGIEGELRLDDFSFRPTLYSPSIDRIHVTLDIDGTRLHLRQAGGIVGNSPVELSGYIDLEDSRKPIYELAVSGRRTPLIRTPNLLLHGDLDLRLDGSDPSTPASLSGTMRLKDSVMLMDLDPMAARTSGQQLPKPPFFNLTAEPFASWLLDIDISGEEFLRFRSPYIKALASIQMDLQGTGANPIWVGEFYSSEGTIEFPGLRMTISRSELFITREMQETLQLDINAIGQVASYVVSMSVDETVDDPHVRFAATPDLNNTQTLHLLATGSPERSSLSSVGLYLGRGLFDPGAANSLWDRFSIEIGRDISETSKDTLDLYYDISDRWRLHGQYDKYDAQNLNLEWEVFSR